MNRSHHRTSRQTATLGIAALLLAAGTALASNGEHTDWPDFPDGDLLKNILNPERLPILRVPRDEKRRPFLTLKADEHTDWPDFPDGDLASFLDKIELPSDPDALPIGQLPSIDDLISPFAPTGGFDGIGSSVPANPGINSFAPVPAPGGALLMIGLAAAAARRRR